jgi:hypothetical protein
MVTRGSPSRPFLSQAVARDVHSPLLHLLLVSSPAGGLIDRELDAAADNAIGTRGRSRRPDFGPGEWWAPQTRPDAYLNLNYN